MAPKSHPHVAILIVMVERRLGTVKDCLQCHLSKTRLIMQMHIKHSRSKKSKNILILRTRRFEMIFSCHLPQHGW
jgi:hypothetical protein